MYGRDRVGEHTKGRWVYVSLCVFVCVNVSLSLFVCGWVVGICVTCRCGGVSTWPSSGAPISSNHHT
jgi:hypothetical protein